MDCAKSEELPRNRRDPQMGLGHSSAFDALNATDDDLLSRLAEGVGRESALPELFSRHSERAMRLAMRFLNDWQQAEEVVQDCFMRLVDKAKLWRGEAGFNTFFTRMLINLCRNRLHRGRDLLDKGKATGSPSVLLGGLAASTRLTEVARNLQAEETRQTVQRALETVPDKYREVLILRELEGMSYKEIATVLEASLDEIRIWIYRGRAHLRNALEAQTDDERE